MLAELDGSVSKLCYATFCLIPYHPRTTSRIPVTSVTGLDDEDLDRMAEEDVERPVLRELGWYQESTLSEGIDDSESFVNRITEVQTTRDDVLK